MLNRALIIIVVLIALFGIDEAISGDEGGFLSTLVGWKDAVFETPDRLMLSALRDDFLHNNMSLQPHQTDYIVELTQKYEEVQKFHKLYCAGDDVNPYLFGADLEYFCTLIRNSDILYYK